MKAILISYLGEDVIDRREVEIDDEHDFAQGPYQDTVPFAVGSNQNIIPIPYEN